MQTKGRYEIRGVLGEGGMGIAYFAMDLFLNQEVTLETIRVISGREAELKEFRNLALAQFDPPGAQLTMQRAAGARLPIADKPPAPPETDYAVRGAPGEEQEQREQRAQIRSGQDALASGDLNRKARPIEPPPPPTCALPVVTSLLEAEPGTWTRNMQADDSDNYLKFELAYKELMVREVRPGKTTEVLKKPHGLSAGQEGFYHAVLR